MCWTIECILSQNCEVTTARSELAALRALRWRHCWRNARRGLHAWRTRTSRGRARRQQQPERDGCTSPHWTENFNENRLRRWRRRDRFSQSKSGAELANLLAFSGNAGGPLLLKGEGMLSPEEVDIRSVEGCGHAAFRRRHLPFRRRHRPCRRRLPVLAGCGASSRASKQSNTPRHAAAP